MDLLDTKIKLKETRSLFNEKRDETEAAIEAGDVDKAKTLKAEVDKLRTDLDELAAKVEELEKDKDDDKDDKDDKDDTQTDETNTNNEGGENRMENRQILGVDVGNEEVRAFDQYLETRDVETDGLKTDEGYVVVPSEENEKIIELADDIVKLKQFVTVKPVSTGSGSQPVRTTAKAKLRTVEELAESPSIGVTPFTEVDYKIKTKRGYIPYSKEYQQDGINLVADLKQYIGEVVVNTENDDILNELTTVRSKTVKTVDELKTLANTGFSAGKKDKIKFLVSQSVFDNLDRLKDNNGRYLLQESITSATGYKLLGKDVVVLDDEYFPNKTTMFVGDLKEIVYFDRAQTSVAWESYMHYGECLGVAVRNDVGKVEDDKTKVNIYKVTVNIPTEAPATPEA